MPNSSPPSQLPQLPSLQEGEFLPHLTPLITIGSLFLVTIFGAAIGLTSILKYSVAVKAPAAVRPAGDLRLVQAAIEGTVKEIPVAENQVVKAGAAIARLDDSRLRTTRSQLQGDIRQKRLQLNQVGAQLKALDAQMLAATDLMQRTIASAQAELRSQQRLYQTQQVVSRAEFQEALTSLNLAKEELSRFQGLADEGVIPLARLKEREAAVQVSEARVNRARAALDPTDAAVARAQEQIAQARARGDSDLATLRQQKEQLLQNQLEVQRQLQRTQKELQQVERDLSGSVVRSPVTGTLFQLNLRNTEQVVRPGEVIASIAPQNAPLLIKAQVPAQEIDKVKPGQKIQMQVSACPHPDFGTLKGTVKTVAPDVLPTTGNASSKAAGATYAVTIKPQTNFVGQGKNQCRLQPGMEGEASIISREETVLKFILRKARLLTDV